MPVGCNKGDGSTIVVTNEDAVLDTSITAEESTATFAIETSDGAYSQNGNIYTITTAGTYSLSGKLEGQIVVAATKNDKVVLELNGTTIIYGQDSLIKIDKNGADEVEISAKKNTQNIVRDNRSEKTVDDDSQGEGAISAKVDLTIKGKGVLVVEGNYNNGIHTTKDLQIKNLSLKATAINNAIKGKDSVTIESGEIVAISTKGDGIETSNTDLNNDGETRGDITLLGGKIAVYAAGDGFSCAHNFVMKEGDENSSAIVSVYTGSYSSYTSNAATTDSYKGVKVKNELNILSGTIVLKTYDDGLHADYGTEFDDGTTGVGTINISGGNITTNVYAPNKATASGRMGPGGFSGQQEVKGADAIHADYKLNISGGTLNIDSAYEGLEANQINILGGEIFVFATDDGLNACSLKANTSLTPQINISGGYVDVAVPSSGECDAIDSNGTYTQTGGIVVVKGPNNQNMAALDTDGTAKISGGTIIMLGYGRITSSVTQYKKLSLHSSGNHTVTIDGTDYVITNSYNYGQTICYSSVKVSA